MDKLLQVKVDADLLDRLRLRAAQDRRSIRATVELLLAAGLGRKPRKATAEFPASPEDAGVDWHRTEEVK